MAVWLCAVKHQMYSEENREINPVRFPSLNHKRLLYRDRAISEAWSTHTDTHTHTHTPGREVILTQKGGESRERVSKKRKK